ncbi:MAG: hypothetical protein AB7F19_04770 [Candidatus Babeliales bacterium]
MNNKITTLAALACLALIQMSFAKQDSNQVEIKKEDIESVQIICGEGATGCKQVITAKGHSASKVMGSAGDREDYNTLEAQKNITNFRTITENKEIILPVPNVGKKLYAITFSKGPYPNEPYKILFYVFSLDESFPEGTPAKVAQEATDAKAADPKRHTAIKVYAKGPRAKQWTETLTIYTPLKKDFGNLKINVQNDGTYQIPNFFGTTLKGDLNAAN